VEKPCLISPSTPNSLRELYAATINIFLTCSASRKGHSTIAARVASTLPRSTSTLKKLEISKLFQRSLNPPGFRGKILFRGQSFDAFHAFVFFLVFRSACDRGSRSAVYQLSPSPANTRRYHGEVTDASGGVIPNVTVTLTHEQTSVTRTAKTTTRANTCL